MLHRRDRPSPSKTCRLNFRTRSGTVKVLERVAFARRQAIPVAIVGESGSGKSVTRLRRYGILPMRRQGQLGPLRSCVIRCLLALSMITRSRRAARPRDPMIFQIFQSAHGESQSTAASVKPIAEFGAECEEGISHRRAQPLALSGREECGLDSGFMLESAPVLRLT